MTVGEGVNVSEGVGDGVILGEGVGVAVSVGVSEGVGVIVGVGDEIISLAENLFWGLGFDCKVKSSKLLSVSVFVFLSMLSPLSGLTVVAPSKSEAVPMPTLSTKVCPLSLYKRTVLFSAREFEAAEYG